MKIRTLLIITMFSLPACDQIKELSGQIVVSVENATHINGFEVRANGKKKFELNAGEKKSFSISGAGTNSIRVVVRHRVLLSSDIVFTLVRSDDDDSLGGSADLVISTEIRFGQEHIILTCPRCGSSKSNSNPVSH